MREKGGRERNIRPLSRSDFLQPYCTSALTPVDGKGWQMRGNESNAGDGCVEEADKASSIDKASNDGRCQWHETACLVRTCSRYVPVHKLLIGRQGGELCGGREVVESCLARTSKTGSTRDSEPSADGVAFNFEHCHWSMSSASRTTLPPWPMRAARF